MNKQPFYHRVDGLLFTSTQEISIDEFIEAIKKSKELKKLGLVIDSVDVEDYSEPEPGDPADLM